MVFGAAAFAALGAPAWAAASMSPAQASYIVFGVTAQGAATLPAIAAVPLPSHTGARAPVVWPSIQYGVVFKAVRPPTAALSGVGLLPGTGLALYGVALDGGKNLIFAAPRGARVTGTVGADGSFGITAKAAGAVLTLTSDSACYGCAVGGSAVFFPSLRSAAAASAGPPPATIAQTRGVAAFRYLGPRLVLYAFRLPGGRVEEGLWAAPMSYKAVGLAYGATWVGPAREAASLGASELRVALRALEGDPPAHG